MGARPLLLLAVLLAGLLGLKTLSLADGAAGLFAERAFAAQSEEGGEEDGEAQDAAAPDEEPSQQPAFEPAASTANAEIPQSAEPRAGQRRSRIPTGSELTLETDLAERRHELARRAEALDTREELLAVAQERYDQRLEELRSLRDEIQSLLADLDTQRDNEITAIVNTYGQLEPDAAASILQAMQGADPDTLLAVAGQLQKDNPRRFAAVMAEMDPGFAAVLTSRLRARAAPEPGPVETEARNAAAGEG